MVISGLRTIEVRKSVALMLKIFSDAAVFLFKERGSDKTESVFFSKKFSDLIDSYQCRREIYILTSSLFALHTRRHVEKRLRTCLKSF